MVVKSKIKVEELKDGDIFYMEKLSPFDLNEDQLGDDHEVTGEDLILIVDSLEPMEDYIGIFTCGGYFFEIDRGTEVYLLGHYAELLIATNEVDNK